MTIPREMFKPVEMSDVTMPTGKANNYEMATARNKAEGPLKTRNVVLG